MSRLGTSKPLIGLPMDRGAGRLCWQVAVVKRASRHALGSMCFVLCLVRPTWWRMCLCGKAHLEIRGYGPDPPSRARTRHGPQVIYFDLQVWQRARRQCRHSVRSAVMCRAHKPACACPLRHLAGSCRAWQHGQLLASSLSALGQGSGPDEGHRRS